MEISPEIVENYLDELGPKEYYTLSKRVKFWVVYERNSFTIINKNNNKIRVNSWLFHNLVVEVLGVKSFKTSYYSTYSHISYLLPIVAELLVFLEEDLELYEPPQGGWSKVKFSQSVPLDEFNISLINSRKSYSKIHQIEIVEDKIESKQIRQFDEKIVDVHYATNRVKVNNSRLFNSEVSSTTNYGIAKISIPKDHKFGKVEKPLGVLNVRFGEKKGKHFTIEQTEELSFNDFRDNLLSEGASDNIIIFIHGYNVDFKGALYKSAQIKNDFKYKKPFLLYSWPSHGNPLAYSGDKERVDQSVDCLVQLIKDLRESGIKNISIIAHSMGTYCLVKALKQLEPQEKKLDSLALASPDIPKFAFVNDYLAYVKSAFSRVALYASSKDKALWLSKNINRDIRLGQAGEHITVVNGVETIDVSEADFGWYKLNHSAPIENSMSMKDLHEFLVRKIPAEDRLLAEAFTSKNEAFWCVHN